MLIVPPMKLAALQQVMEHVDVGQRPLLVQIMLMGSRNLVVQMSQAPITLKMAAQIQP